MGDSGDHKLGIRDENRAAERARRKPQLKRAEECSEVHVNNLTVSTLCYLALAQIY